MKLPSANESASLISKATAIRETWSANDASAMIESGFVLVSVSPRKAASEDPFVYCLIWIRPLAETPPEIRSQWNF